MKKFDSFVNENIFDNLKGSIKSLSDGQLGSELRKKLQELKIPIVDESVSLLIGVFSGSHENQYDLAYHLKDDQNKLIPNVLIMKEEESGNPLYKDSLRKGGGSGMGTILWNPIEIFTLKFDFTGTNEIKSTKSSKMWNFATSVWDQGTVVGEAEEMLNKDNLIKLFEALDKIGSESFIQSAEKAPMIKIGDLLKNQDFKDEVIKYAKATHMHVELLPQDMASLVTAPAPAAPAPAAPAPQSGATQAPATPAPAATAAPAEVPPPPPPPPANESLNLKNLTNKKNFRK